MVVSLIERIGISTHFLPAANGESIWDAIDQVNAMGLHGFELVPDDYRGQLTEPYVPEVGIWPPDLTGDQRRRLREALSVFDTVTVQSSRLDLNIASMNPGIREESCRQYFECMDLARDLGIRVVSFHRGDASAGDVQALSEIERHNVQFARRAAELADERDMVIGLRVGGSGGLESQMREIEAIGSERVGISLALGRATIAGPPPEVWARRFAGKIIAVHLSGVLRDWSGCSDHQPIERNNLIDYEAVLAELHSQGFEGPLVCEIQGLDIENAVSHALAARALLSVIWERL
jgi:sugar phosphate isomerase/epimerase